MKLFFSFGAKRLSGGCNGRKGLRHNHSISLRRRIHTHTSSLLPFKAFKATNYKLGALTFSSRLELAQLLSKNAAFKVRVSVTRYGRAEHYANYASLRASEEPDFPGLMDPSSRSMP